MAIDIRQTLKLSQQLMMTPQLQQAIKLLQLTRVELEQFITSQLAENPTLEESAFESEEIDQKQEKTAEDYMAADINEVSSGLDNIEKDQQKEVDWEALARHKEISAQSNQQTANRKNSTGDTPNYENYLSKDMSLGEHLSGQLAELDLTDTEKQISAEIIGNLNEKGYLDATIEGMASRLDASPDQVDDMLDCIQRLDPPGVAALDLKQCLMIQLRTHGLKNGIVENIVETQMKELETWNYNQIAKNLNLTLDKVIANVATIAELDPIPARQFGIGSSQYIVPDVYVFKLGDKWVTSLNDEGLPRLRVSDFTKKC